VLGGIPCVVLVWLTSSCFNYDDAYFFVHFHTQNVTQIILIKMLNECVHNIQFPAISAGKLQLPPSVEAMTDSLSGDTTFVTLSFR
jgi:hypothetical protein